MVEDMLKKKSENNWRVKMTVKVKLVKNKIETADCTHQSVCLLHLKCEDVRVLF